MIKIVLVDDEINSLRSLEWEIQNFSKDFEIIAGFTNPQEAIMFLRRNEADCVFVDIEMPQMDGFPVIVTAYAQYAIQAIKEEAFDYLLKPVDPDDLTLTLDKIKSKIYQRQQSRSLLPAKLSSKIPLSLSGKIVYLNPEEILYCESDGNYTKVFLEDETHLFLTKKIKEIQELLPEHSFFRIHNSFVINMVKVKEFIKSENYVVLNNGKKIPVSRNKRALFLGFT